jgi:uncharacterized LabA/DUF88 family protein
MQDPLIAAVFIDGFNLYHAIDALKNPCLKWVNLFKLSEALAGKDYKVGKVVYFTAIQTWDQRKAERHKQYIAAQQAVSVETVISKFQRTGFVCQKTGNSCKRYEEKETDVAFATQALHAGLSGDFSKLILITADSDQVPTVKLLRAARPGLKIEIATPPKRLQIARELCSHATSKKEISPGLLGSCRLPRSVHSKQGRLVAACPPHYNCIWLEIKKS